MSPSSSTFLRSGFFSRLSLPLHLPLRSRPRTITDFYIICDEPHKKYNATDPVRGTVVLVVTKPLRLTHLVVTLHGSVRVLKEPAAVAKVQSITTLPRGGSSSRPRYHGNGFASLFQDEQVLCGEGRLEPGRYEFKFDLVFPDKGLPSSIDFERGSISYMVTATLTKPTQIAATVSCDRKITLTEKINVGELPPPRPRTIFLEPRPKRTRRKKSSLSLEKGGVMGPETIDLTSETDSLGRHSVAVTDSVSPSLRDGQAPSEHRRPGPQSDAQSEASGDSARTASSGPNPHDYRALSHTDASFNHESAYQQAVNDKTITATIELLKGGCLPGDTVSVRVTVQHVKCVKSMRGVVVTLFRQGKIDYAPPTSLFSGVISKEDARRLQRDEKYPRSRTGLSGLSLSSTSSISMFRKDLDQITAPLIIDPVTLQASITVPVKIPDDSFPTIKGVPGDMISFKYHVEVIVDLGGKSSGQLQGRHSSSRLGHFSTSASDQSFNMFSSRRGAHIVETSELKRQQGVICVSMESVVGTMDSSSSILILILTLTIISTTIFSSSIRIRITTILHRSFRLHDQRIRTLTNRLHRATHIRRLLPPTRASKRSTIATHQHLPFALLRHTTPASSAPHRSP
ncbi:pH-response regulator protein palF/RIM8 [Escovopsis weberi]|uniref:pH-response regulator protein palF/RIM8 n=1 Tax=Escovopsis weberi TaxID=150374 RepID=A0A0M8MZD9_ESCWE|nr:pH-response regulator protein palF/RIM8 [Escovopsis weberi]